MHSGLSIVLPVSRERESEAKCFLLSVEEELKKYMEAKNSIQAFKQRNCKFPFCDIPSTVSASAVIIPEQDYLEDSSVFSKIIRLFIRKRNPDAHKNKPGKLPPTLLFLTSYSGALDIHLNELTTKAGDGLRKLFSFCEVAPDDRLDTDDGLTAFLKKYSKDSTYYTGLPPATCSEILSDEQLRVDINFFLDSQPKEVIDAMHPFEVRKKIQDYITGKMPDRTLPGRSKELPPDLPSGKNINWLRIIFFGAITMTVLFSFLVRTYGLTGFRIPTIILVILLSLGALLALTILLIEYEKKPGTSGINQDEHNLATIARVENPRLMNELTAAGPVKPGLLRPLLFRLILRLAKITSKPFTIPTVANARWIALNNGKRLVFISNFTNISESYVRDFIDFDDSAAKINFLFGCGNGFPRTQLLFERGVFEKPDQFIQTFKKNQHLTQFWYWPYGDLSAANILNNRKIREGLFGNLNSEETKIWLGCL